MADQRKVQLGVSRRQFLGRCFHFALTNVSPWAIPMISAAQHSQNTVTWIPSNRCQ